MADFSIDPNDYSQPQGAGVAFDPATLRRIMLAKALAGSQLAGPPPVPDTSADDSEDDASAAPVPQTGPYGKPSVTLDGAPLQPPARPPVGASAMPLARALAGQAPPPPPPPLSSGYAPPGASAAPPGTHYAQGPGAPLLLRDDQDAATAGGMAQPPPGMQQKSFGIGNAPATLPASTAIAGRASDIGQPAAQEDATTSGYRAMHDSSVAAYQRAIGMAQQTAGTPASAVYLKIAEDAAKQANDVNMKAIEYGKPLKTVTAGQYVLNPATGKYEQPVPEEDSTRAPNEEETARLVAAGENPKNYQSTDGKLERIPTGKTDSTGFGVIGEDQFGNKQYGFTDKTTGQVTPYKPPAGAPGTDAASLDLHGDDFMATLDPKIAGQVKAIVDGRAPYPTGMLLRTPYGQQLAAMVTQADPTFESGNATARTATRKEFESGGPNSVAGTITSGNAAIKHLGELSDDAEALGNRSIPLWNAAANAYETQTGDKRVTNFNNTIGRFGEEATKFYRGIGGSEADVQRDIANLSPNMSPDQLRGAIQKQANLMRDKIVAYQDRWHKAMGPMVPDFPIVDPSTQNVLGKLDQRAGGASVTQGSEAAPQVAPQPAARNVAPNVTGAPPPQVSPQDAAKLPSGTHFTGTDGIARVRH